MTQKKEKFLRVFGLTHSTLSQRLKSKLIYEFFKMRDGVACHRCGAPVEIGDHSLDHGKSFWDSDDPWEAFFDLSACFMSHKVCNYQHGSSEAKPRLKERHQERRDLIRGMYEQNSERDCESLSRAEHAASGDLRENEPAKEGSKDADGDAL